MTTSQFRLNLLTSAALAKILGLSAPTVRKAAHEGEMALRGVVIRPIEVAGSIRWVASDVAAALGCDEAALLTDAT